MACLSFGRPMLRGGGPPPSVAAAEAGSSASWSLANLASPAQALAVPEDPVRISAEGAVFDAVAQQATAFICNLDEATVNCGAVELGCSAGAACCASAGDATPPGSCSNSLAHSGASCASSTVRSPTEGGDGSRAGSGWDGGGWSGAALFRRLSAAKADSGFGWHERRAAFEAAMERENRVERLVARCDAAAAEKRLQHRLMVARLEPAAFRGCAGGNSLFDALSLALWGTAAHGRCLRALAVAHAAQHPAEYRCFLGDDWEAYLCGMARPGTPGDELMLRAVADHFGLPINIVTSDAFMWFQRYAPYKTRSRREVTLAFLGPCTWMPIRRQSAMTTLRLSLSGGSEWRQARDIRRRMGQMDLQQQHSMPR